MVVIIGVSMSAKVIMAVIYMTVYRCCKSSSYRGVVPQARTTSEIKSVIERYS
jgi:hypothetical protein